ncbi:hypothetical protein BDW59DRAFT_126034 [Aspergillus cavernicola]|uniref:Uncharacterized protein n=1 Tax=Aspergillus cavernicola TaxID=176166 RepID=A0ABR4HV54_9EURO
MQEAQGNGGTNAEKVNLDPLGNHSHGRGNLQFNDPIQRRQTPDPSHIEEQIVSVAGEMGVAGIDLGLGLGNEGASLLLLR